jgi:hypothetical protein
MTGTAGSTSNTVPAATIDRQDPHGDLALLGRDKESNARIGASPLPAAQKALCGNAVPNAATEALLTICRYLSRRIPVIAVRKVSISRSASTWRIRSGFSGSSVSKVAG